MFIPEAHKSILGKADSKSNVIYIFADDPGFGELGCYGQEKMKTPNLDKMAEQGMRFTRHYVETPVCVPSRHIRLLLGITILLIAIYSFKSIIQFDRVKPGEPTAATSKLEL